MKQLASAGISKNLVFTAAYVFQWILRRFLILISCDTVKRIQPLTSTKRVCAFVVDDSMFERNPIQKSPIRFLKS